jgi:uncharacterized protein (DUF952 family)
MKTDTAETYIYVTDNVRGDKTWIKQKYVELYPELYTPIQFNGVTLKSDFPNANPCLVRT